MTQERRRYEMRVLDYTDYPEVVDTLMHLDKVENNLKEYLTDYFTDITQQYLDVLRAHIENMARPLTPDQKLKKLLKKLAADEQDASIKAQAQELLRDMDKGFVPYGIQEAMGIQHVVGAHKGRNRKANSDKALEFAKDTLRTALGKGPRPAKEVQVELIKLGVSPYFMRKAFAELGCDSYRTTEPGQQYFLWALPTKLEEW